MLIRGDARAIPLRDGSVHCVVTSPPYHGLRNYRIGDAGIGLDLAPHYHKIATRRNREIGVRLPL